MATGGRGYTAQPQAVLATTRRSAAPLVGKISLFFSLDEISTA